MTDEPEEEPMAERVCPWWVGYLLASPIRKWFQNPDKVVGPHVEPGMKVLDVGCAMGFFSLPMATMVGRDGQVICVDMQQRMLDSLVKRASRAGVQGQITPHRCTADGLGLDDHAGQIDFAAAIAMVHEVPDQPGLMAELHASLVPGGKLLIAEPSGHVPAADFETTVALAQAAGFVAGERNDSRRIFSVILHKPA